MDIDSIAIEDISINRHKQYANKNQSIAKQTVRRSTIRKSSIYEGDSITHQDIKCTIKDKFEKKKELQEKNKYTTIHYD